MHDERLEGTGRALDDRLAPLDQIQNVDAAPRMMLNSTGEPVPPRLDELPLMQAGAFLTPSSVSPGDITCIQCGSVYRISSVNGSVSQTRLKIPYGFQIGIADDLH